MTRRCIALLGGSFDPVHNGHVALGEYFIKLLAPDELRIIPAGNPWQKHGLQADPQDRVEMVRRAFDRQPLPVTIDQQEIVRSTATYTIDTLRAVRAELGATASIVFLLGADQLHHLNSWQEWQHLFDYAHLCAASRPGFAIDASHLPVAVAREFARRAATPEQIRNTPHGLTYLASNLAVDVSATAIRAALQSGERPESLIPATVLDYIEQHHLYKS
ncbi:MAG: putative nicotinic acid mononucleotide adenylyltransferase, NAD(P)-requiring, NadD-like [Herminiimonas sp.]|nr:putative nicotinic acid mononucleotide adenylyltransferase, NAD(P)-requiring, NadD-like [Herminiimonas sp.]